MASENPAALADYDPQWPVAAQRLLLAIQEQLRDIPGVGVARFEHIGSTSVPGLAAKPFIDLQVCVLPLPDDDELIQRLTPLGYHRARGSRPDSPGVYRDIPRGDTTVDEAVWSKSLFFHPNEHVILHVRRSDSPWARYTVWFRDWLRSDPRQRSRYESIKRELSIREAGKDDYDDYTRAKSDFFDEVQSEFEHWATKK